MFEVGKKYRRCDKAYSEYIYECVYVQAGYAVLKLPNDFSAPFVTNGSLMYEEYKEPRELTGYVNVWEKKEWATDKGTLEFGGMIYSDKASAERAGSSSKRVAIVEVKYKEPN